MSSTKGFTKGRIAVAMSGGVDSSTVAALLCEEGWDVVGVTLKLYNAKGTAASMGGRCCGPRDIEDARLTAAHLGIPHYVLDETRAFSEGVIDGFVEAHKHGLTPNPCVRCNERLKFGPLVDFAHSIGAEALATGHYARVSPARDGQRARIFRARDRDKDQSYFLFGVDPSIFAHVRFPLGDKTKDEVRAIAAAAGLPNACKPDSQQICFIPDGDHRAFVETHGGAGPSGEVVDEEGHVLGAHAGTHGFTVGQRKGVPGVDGTRRFVLRIDAGSGRVVVGPRSLLERTDLRLSEMRWWDGPLPRDAVRCEVQIRHHAAAQSASLWSDSEDAALVRLDAPASGVAAGQAAVVYRDDELLGGGFIAAS
jgi:tRNA-specific 2-thiouridylase